MLKKMCKTLLYDDMGELINKEDKMKLIRLCSYIPDTLYSNVVVMLLIRCCYV